MAVCMQNQLDFLLGQPCAAWQSGNPPSGYDWFFLIFTFFCLTFPPLLYWIFWFAQRKQYIKSPVYWTSFSYYFRTALCLLLRPSCCILGLWRSLLVQKRVSYVFSFLFSLAREMVVCYWLQKCIYMIITDPPCQSCDRRASYPFSWKCTFI